MSGGTTVADALVDELIRCGADTVFGIGGTHTMALLGAIERARAPRFVPPRTELGGAYMALGYARATGRPAVILTSTGPGCLNVTAALQDAQWSAIPALHLTTSVGGDGFSGLVHETPTQRAIMDLAGKGSVAVTAATVREAVRRAVLAATSRPRGVVTLDVPAGIWRDLATNASLGAPAPGVPAPGPDLTEILGALDAAARPLLFVGGGALAGDPAAALLLAETLQAPILTSYQGKGVADWTHPLYLGPWASEPRVRDLVAEADVAIVLGSKLSSLGTGYHQLTLPEATFAVGPVRSPHPRYQGLRVIDADATAVARRLAAGLKPRCTSWVADRVATTRRAVLDEVAARSGDELAFLAAVADAAYRPALVSADMCKAGFWLMKHLDCPAGSVHAFSSYLAMGTALPLAIGMTIGRAEPSLAVVGDGGLQMSLAELATIAELRLPVAVMVLVDGAYGMLKDNSAAAGGSAELGLNLWNPDLRTLALAYGITAEDIATPGDLTKALDRPTTGPRLLLVNAPFGRGW